MTGAKYEQTLRGHALDLTHEGHRHWMRENNPDGWDDATWKAFNARMDLDHGFADRVQRTHRARCAWISGQVEIALSGRRASAEVRLQLRADLLREAHQKHPRPHPTEDGWIAPRNADPLSAIGSSAKRTAQRPQSTRPAPNDSAGIQAAREAAARRTVAEEAENA